MSHVVDMLRVLCVQTTKPHNLTLNTEVTVSISVPRSAYPSDIPFCHSMTAILQTSSDAMLNDAAHHCSTGAWLCGLKFMVETKFVLKLQEIDVKVVH